MKEMLRTAARWSGTIAWVVMLVAVSVLFWDEAKDDAKDRRDGRVALEAAHDASRAVERIEQEGLERDYQLCTNSNEARAGVLSFIEALAARDDDPSPAQQEFLDLARETFAQKPCPPDPSPGE